MSWPLVMLKDCCTIIGGATPKRDVEAYWSSKDVPWVTPKDISKINSMYLNDAPEYISNEGYKSCAAQKLPKGSLLLSSRAPIGNIAITTKEMCTNQGFKSLIPSEKIDIKYLYFCMLYSAQRLENEGNGATFKEVSKKVVEAFKIPLPPLDTQKKIAAVLEKADQLRKDCQQMEQELNSLAQSIFIDMFGDPVTNPKKLTQQNILECLNVTTGKLDSNAAVDDGAFPFFTCAKTASKIDKYAFDQEALLLAGNNAQGIYDVKYYKGKFNAYQRTYVLSLKDDRGSFRYFQFALEFQLKRLQQQSKGSNTKYITMGIMRDTYLQIPNYSDQERFSDIYLKIFEQLELLNIQKEANKANFSALMEQAFNGKLNLTDAPH